MTLAEIKRTVNVGDVFDVTNHFITRPDHPCFGKRRVTVVAVSGSSFTLAGSQLSRVRWPKAHQVRKLPGDSIEICGLGVGQRPEELTLTLVPVDRPS